MIQPAPDVIYVFSNLSKNLKRNQPQRNDQTYPREIPPRFQRRMKQQQQQQQTVFPQQVPTTTSTSQITPVQVQAAVQSQQTVQNKAVSKPTPAGELWMKLVQFGSIGDGPYWTSWENSLELIELSSINKVSLV